LKRGHVGGGMILAVRKTITAGVDAAQMESGAGLELHQRTGYG